MEHFRSLVALFLLASMVAACSSSGPGSAEGEPSSASSCDDYFSANTVEDPLPLEDSDDVFGDQICGESGDLAGPIRELERCRLYKGSIVLSDHTQEDHLRPLRGLEIVEGDVSFFRHRELNTLLGLNELRQVHGSLSMKFMTEIKTFSPHLARLEEVGTLYISGITQLRTLNGLSSLRTVHRMYIGNNEALESLAGLSSLEHITGDLEISNNPSLPRAAIDCLIERVQMDGEVYIDP